MKCKLFNCGYSTIESEINNWLATNKNITIEQLVATDGRLYLFYSTRKTKLETLNTI